jgi:DNA-binding NtrC family response regulator
MKILVADDQRPRRAELAERLARLGHEVATPANVRINGQVDSFHSAMQKTERELLEHALQASRGNKTAAAAALGMRPSTFRDKLARHQLG